MGDAIDSTVGSLHMLRRRLVLQFILGFATLGGPARLATAQAGGTVDRLDIRGGIMFPAASNAPPAFFSELLVAGGVHATRTSGSGALGADSGILAALPDDGPFTDTLPAPNGIQYSVPVGNVDAGSAYRINAHVFFDDAARDVYHFDALSTGTFDPATLPVCSPVIGDPPVVCLDGPIFSECAALVRIRFVLVPSGPAIAVNDPNHPRAGSVRAVQTAPSPGPNDAPVQAATTIVFNEPTVFPVQAGICAGLDCSGAGPQTMLITIVATQGTDPFCDTVTTTLEQLVEVACGGDETIEVVLPDISGTCCCCEPPTGDCTGVTLGDAWQLTGPAGGALLEDDVVYFSDPGSPVNPTRVVPRIVLDRGPAGNLRLGEVISPNGGTTSNAYAPSATMAPFLLENVVPSDSDPTSPVNRYRAWDIHILNDGATAFSLETSGWEPVVPLLSGTSSRRKPCGPGLLPCGRVGFNETSRAAGIEGSPGWTTGALLFDNCDTLPSPTIPPIATHDSQHDWLFIESPAPPLIRCPPVGGVFLPDPGTVDIDCIGLITPFVPGGSVYSPTDELRLFALAPGQLRGALKLTDGHENCADHLPGVLEHLRYETALFDAVSGGAYDALYMESFMEAHGNNMAAGNCLSATATNLGDKSALFRSNLLRNPEVAPSTQYGEQEWHYRVVPAQIGNIGGWYQWNRLNLRFDSSPALGRDDYIKGTLLLNHEADPGTGLGDMRRREFFQGMNIREDIDYCLGELVVRVRSRNAPISASLAQRSLLRIKTRSGTITAGGTPYVSVSEFEGTTASGSDPAQINHWVQFNVPLPAGAYDATPMIWFDGATGRTAFPTIVQPCPVQCGHITKICGIGDEGPLVTATEMTGGPVGTTGSCTSGAVVLCINDCNGRAPVCHGMGGSDPLADVYLCSDESALGVADAANCPVSHPYRVDSRIPCTADAGLGAFDAACPSSHPFRITPSSPTDPVTIPVTDDIASCTEIVFAGLPRDVCASPKSWAFRVRDYAIECNQVERLHADVLVDLTSVDDSQPVVSVPDERWECATWDPVASEWRYVLTGWCATATDNCTLSAELGWRWSASSDDDCASVDPTSDDDDVPNPVTMHEDADRCVEDAVLTPGTTRFTWHAKDDCAVEGSAFQLIHVSAPPVACIVDEVEPYDERAVCRSGEPLQVQLVSCSDEDAEDDCFDDTITHSWQVLSGPCTIDVNPATPTIADIEIDDDGRDDCYEVETCLIQLTVSKAHPNDPMAVICSDVIDYTIVIHPRPVVVLPDAVLPDVTLEDTIVACTSPGATTEFALDGCSSHDCGDPNSPIPHDDALLWSWTFNASAPGCEGISLTLENPADNYCSPLLTFDNAEGCADCLIDVQVTDPVTGCVSAVTPLRVIIRETPRAIIGEILPFCVRPDPADDPSIVPLDGSGSLPANVDSCCAGITYKWTIENCANPVTVTFVDPSVTPVPDPTTIPQPNLVIPAGTDLADCEACLEVRHCAGELSAGDPGCVSAKTCVPLDWCVGPDAMFETVFVPCMNWVAQNRCAVPLAQFRNLSTWGNCEEDVDDRSATWTWGGAADMVADCDDTTPVPATDPLVLGGADADGSSTGSTPVFESILYDTPGLKYPALEVDVDPPGCPSTHLPECGVCVPCLSLFGNVGPIADGGLDFQVDCSNPCTTPNLDMTLRFQDLLDATRGCCSEPSIGPGATAALTFVGCNGGAISVVVGAVPLDPVINGNHFDVRFRLIGIELLRMLESLGCTCNSANALKITVDIQLDLLCACNATMSEGCAWPIVVQQTFGPSNSDRIFDIRCTGQGCLTGTATTTPTYCSGNEFRCTDGIDNDSQGGTDCADASSCSAAIHDLDGDGYVACGATPDCDDLDPSRNPGEVEVCWDGIDNDCDGLIDGADTADCPSGTTVRCP